MIFKGLTREKEMRNDCCRRQPKKYGSETGKYDGNDVGIFLQRRSNPYDNTYLIYSMFDELKPYFP